MIRIPMWNATMKMTLNYRLKVPSLQIDIRSGKFYNYQGFKIRKVVSRRKYMRAVHIQIELCLYTVRAQSQISATLFVLSDCTSVDRSVVFDIIKPFKEIYRLRHTINYCQEGVQCNLKV